MKCCPASEIDGPWLHQFSLRKPRGSAVFAFPGLSSPAPILPPLECGRPCITMGSDPPRCGGARGVEPAGAPSTVIDPKRPLVAPRVHAPSRRSSIRTRNDARRGALRGPGMATRRRFPSRPPWRHAAGLAVRTRQRRSFAGSGSSRRIEGMKGTGGPFFRESVPVFFRASGSSRGRSILSMHRPPRASVPAGHRH